MKKIFTLFMFFLTINGFSQNFAPQGATWYYSYSSVFFDGFVKIRIVGDTIIHGIVSQKLLKTLTYLNFATGQVTTDTFLGYEFTYVDQKHVYQLIGDEFRVLYDFEVQVNDTIFIYNSEFYDWTNECDSVGRALVTETGTEIINGLELRWYKIVTLEESPFILNGKIIERIGNTTGSLFSLPSDCIYIQEWIGQFLRCYADDDFPEYKLLNYNGPCDFITGIDEITLEQNFFSFYPNPATDQLTIEINENAKIKLVSIFTIDGKLIRLIPLSEPIFNIDISGLLSGVYLLEAETEDGYREVKRLSIEY